MKLEVELNDDLVKAALRSCMENYPEFSTASLQCISWKYKEGIYRFEEDDESGDIKVHTVTPEMMFEGFKKLLANRPQCVPPPPSEQTQEAWDNWCCQMDADGVDCLLQFALFGELIYG